MAHSPILSRPFYDLGLESTLRRTSHLQELSQAYQDNVHSILQAERDRVAANPGLGMDSASGRGSISGGMGGQPTHVRLMAAMQAQKRPLYSPSAPSLVGLGKAQPRSPPSSPVAALVPVSALAPASDSAAAPPADHRSASLSKKVAPSRALPPASPHQRPSSPAGYSPQPWAAATALLPPSLQPQPSAHSKQPSISNSNNNSDNNNQSGTHGASDANNLAASLPAHDSRSGASPPLAAASAAPAAAAAPIVLPLSRVLSAPEVRSRLSSLSSSRYAEDMRALSPQARRLLSADAEGAAAALAGASALADGGRSRGGGGGGGVGSSVGSPGLRGCMVEIGEGTVRVLSAGARGGRGGGATWADTKDGDCQAGGRREGEGGRLLAGAGADADASIAAAAAGAGVEVGAGAGAETGALDAAACRLLEAAVLGARGRAERDAEVAAALQRGRAYVADR